MLRETLCELLGRTHWGNQQPRLYQVRSNDYRKDICKEILQRRTE